MLVTILNDRFPGRLTTDGGAKAFTLNKPNAAVIGEPDMDYNAGSGRSSDRSRSTEPLTKTYKIGDKLECIVARTATRPSTSMTGSMGRGRTRSKWCGRLPVAVTAVEVKKRWRRSLSFTSDFILRTLDFSTSPTRRTDSPNKRRMSMG